MRIRSLASLLAVCLSAGSTSGAATPAKTPARTPAASVLAPLDALYPELDSLYLDLHRNPELSQHEEKTAAKMAERLRSLGFAVTTGFAGHGVVGVLENGAGPTVMLRTELDALPVEERTGLPYASRVTTKDDSGATVSVMHACGHDIHMASWVGAATLLARAKDRWKGTLVMIGQPDEEKGSGAKKMLDAGLFTRFPRPDFVVAIHDSPDLPAGKIGARPGFALANVDAVDITVYGRGGHGAYPHKTVDPIVIAARTIVALQTIVSREQNPFDPAVVTVGSIHGGTKHNIIPDEVRLQLTVRSYKEEVRKRLHAAIERVAKAEAAAAGAPKEPRVTVTLGDPATYNDPKLMARLAKVLAQQFGQGAVLEPDAVMAGEDFSWYGRAGVPTAILWVGGVAPERFEAAQKAGTALPGLHSSEWAPDREPTIRTGVGTLTTAALELLGK